MEGFKIVAHPIPKPRGKNHRYSIQCSQKLLKTKVALVFKGTPIEIFFSEFTKSAINDLVKLKIVSEDTWSPDSSGRWQFFCLLEGDNGRLYHTLAGGPVANVLSLNNHLHGSGISMGKC